MTHLFYKFIFCLSVAGIFLSACKDEKQPAYLMPTVTVEDAREITRTTALLSGEVKKNGEEAVTELHFRYGTTPEMEHGKVCDPSQSEPSVTLTDLQPNTTYYFCLEAGNGYSTAQSPSLAFTTRPNEAPAIGGFRMLNQGPLSITLQYELTDDGGEPLSATGLYYRTENGKEKQLPVTINGNSVFRARLSGLQEKETYTVQAYAANSIGETRSEAFSFHTGQAVITTTPGTLSEAMDTDEKYRYTALSIAGPLDGSDIRFIREMLGRDINGEETPGRLNRLDMTDAVICSGGASYDGMRYTADNVAGYGMFADCIYLQELRLPGDTREIEENAFKNCRALASLQIPAATSRVTPSDGCDRLTAVEVAEGNNFFCSADGVLYNKDSSRLLWFPEGKEDVLSFPATLTCIGEYAFRNCRMRKLELPSTVSEIKKGAFYGAHFESIALPEQLELISSGLFQGCGNLTSVTLGSRTNYLSAYCFDDCPLRHLYVTTEDMPPMCEENTFNEDIYKNCVLHVPAACLSMYRNSQYWGRFENIQGPTYSPPVV